MAKNGPEGGGRIGAVTGRSQTESPTPRPGPSGHRHGPVHERQGRRQPFKGLPEGEQMHLVTAIRTSPPDTRPEHLTGVMWLNDASPTRRESWSSSGTATGCRSPAPTVPSMSRWSTPPRWTSGQKGNGTDYRQPAVALPVHVTSQRRAGLRLSGWRRQPGTSSCGAGWVSDGRRDFGGGGLRLAPGSPGAHQPRPQHRYFKLRTNSSSVSTSACTGSSAAVSHSPVSVSSRIPWCGLTYGMTGAR